MKKYKIWLEDLVEPLGGFWWYCFDIGDGYLRQVNYDYIGKEDELDTLDKYLKWGYKIIEL